jgi:hypothetical protein
MHPTTVCRALENGFIERVTPTRPIVTIFWVLVFSISMQPCRENLKVKPTEIFCRISRADVW